MNSFYLDAKTIMFLLSGGLALSALAIFYLHRQHKSVQGILFWAMAYLCSAISLSLVGFREQIPSYLSVLLSNMFLFASFILFYFGSCKYTKTTPKIKLIIVTIIFLFTPFIFLYHSEQYFRYRLMLTNIYLSLFSFIIANTLAGKRSSIISTQRVASVLFYTESLIHALTVIWLILTPLIVVDLFGQIQPIIFLQYWILIVNSSIAVGILILISAAFIMMVAEQLRNTLKEQLYEIEVARKSAELTITEQRNFYTMLSHEFKTPISIITASTEIISMNLPCSSEKNKDESKEEVARINRSANRLNTIIDSILADDYLDSYAQDSELKSTSLRSVLDKLKNEYPFELTYSSDSDFIIHANPHTLPHIFANLLDNAIKYANNDDAVKVSCYQQLSEKIIVEVIDDGRGISLDEKDIVFEKYYRSKQAYSKQGSGLGLYHVKRIIDSHHAHIENEQVKNHNIFRVIFPIISRDIDAIN